MQIDVNVDDDVCYAPMLVNAMLINAPHHRWSSRGHGG